MGVLAITTLNTINLPDELYQELEKLAQAKNESIESQIVVLLQKALQIQKTANRSTTQKSCFKSIRRKSKHSTLKPSRFWITR
ncbi:hypothetical protein WJM97_12215 [Okeanomitos corallinicola TIOX110]|uniref:CopG-like ribbon-helix-helix domain-containing protein n=1 Tax=Okeanomitos corallinicola TIOX110 TaxID=3133117 RepID=A0ABZ2UNY1_9CYAN